MEQNELARFFKQVMSVPHREYAPMVQSFRELVEADPHFAGRAFTHLATGGTKIRDQEDASIIALIQSPYPDYREAGRCLLLGEQVYGKKITPEGIRGLPLFRVHRIMSFINGSDRKAPRFMKDVASDYLAWLSEDNERFDGIVINARDSVKWMYTTYHLQPSIRAQGVLFDKKYPKGSSFELVREIANAPVEEQAEMIFNSDLPYRIASTVVKKMTPAIAIALITLMTPNEARNSQAWVERHKLMEIEAVASVFIKKVSMATDSIASIQHRASAQVKDERLVEAKKEAIQKAVKAEAINGKVLIAVDRSGSMDKALTVAREFGARFGSIMKDDVFVTAFSTHAAEIEIEDRTQHESWEKGFSRIRAGGGTCASSALRLANDKGFEPDRVLVISDGADHQGDFAGMFKRIYEEVDPPQLVYIQIPSSDHENLTGKLDRAGIEYDKFEYSGDYYVLDQVQSLMSGKPRRSIIDMILEKELPRRV